MLCSRLGYSVSAARNLVILLRNTGSQKGLMTPRITRKRCCYANKLRKVQYDVGYNVFTNERQHSEQPESISNTCVVEKVDSNVIPDSSDMCDNDIQTDQNAIDCDDERVELANLIANLKLDVDENKKIQKQLKKANTTLAHELTECKSFLAETSRTLGESNSIRDSCLVALQNKQTKFERYKTLNDRTVDYEKIKHKLNETLGLLAQKDINIKEGLKLKAYEISIVQEKHDELGKQSLLTKSHYEGLVKEKTKISHDQSDHANRVVPDREETLTLERESRSKLNKDLVRPYDYTKLINTHTELQCLYLHKVKECECLAQKLSKQTDFVSKEVYTRLLRSFAKLEKHSISLKLALQQYQEQMKNDTDCKEKASSVFQKEREQYFKTQDLKAQLQDKNIAICELKKLIKKCKGKSVETKFDKPSVVRQPNAQRIPKPSVFGKPAPFLDSLERKKISKIKSVPKTNVSDGLSKPVTTHNLPQTARQAARNTNVIKPSVTHKTNVSRPLHRSNQMKDKVVPNNSQVKDKKIEVEDHPRISSISNKTKSVTTCNDSLKTKTSNVNDVYATCGKCVFNSNHDVCVSKFLNDVNARTKKPNNSKSYYRMLYEKTSKAWKRWIEQQCPSGYKWVPKLKMKWLLKVRNENVEKRVSFAIDNASRITNINKAYDGQSNATVASQKSSCFVRDLQGNDLLVSNRGSDLYTISFQETTSSTPICLMAKALPTQVWLWHRRLSHLNFDYINLLSKKDAMIGLPKLKYVKDQLCPSCEVSKAKRSSFKTKAVPSSKGRLNLLHIDGENLDKIKEKEDSCILVGYSTQSKGYRVYNKRTRLIVESIHLRFDEIKETSERGNPRLLQDHAVWIVVALAIMTRHKLSTDYEEYTNGGLCTQDSYVAGSSRKDKGPTQEYILLPLHPHRTRIPVEDITLATHEKPFESSPLKTLKYTKIQKDVADKE
ncbi:retrovirus-related pol polyprotein from transposon TNT 1-94 [Tanacetum coccineum]